MISDLKLPKVLATNQRISISAVSSCKILSNGSKTGVPKLGKILLTSHRC